MLKIRLQRVGRKNHAEFRVVVTESTKGPKSANYLEILGAYNPHTNAVTVEADRIKHWISKGAQPSDTVHNILVGQKVIEGTKERIQPFKGVVIQRKNTGVSETVTVRKVTDGVAVERIFPVHSPRIASFKIESEGKVRKARIFDMRKLMGKAARIDKRQD